MNFYRKNTDLNGAYLRNVESDIEDLKKAFSDLYGVTLTIELVTKDNAPYGYAASITALPDPCTAEMKAACDLWLHSWQKRLFGDLAAIAISFMDCLIEIRRGEV